MKTPQFVVVEGADGVGTTSCSKRLHALLVCRNIKAIWTHEPTDGPIGRYIRELLIQKRQIAPKAQLHLFMADRYEHLQNTILPILKEGGVVICDRYAYSTWCYQQEFHDAFLIEHLCRDLVAPDHVFVLHAPLHVCEHRRGERKVVVELFDSRHIQKRIAERYRKLFRIGDERFHHIETDDLSIEDVVERMLARLSVPVLDKVLEF